MEDKYKKEALKKLENDYNELIAEYGYRTPEEIEESIKKSESKLKELEKDEEKNPLDIKTFNNLYRIISYFKRDKILREKVIEILEEYDVLSDVSLNIVNSLYGESTNEPLRTFGLSDFEKEFPEPPCYINGIIYHSGTTLIASDPGTGKTWVLLAMAGHLISGKTFYIHSVPKKVKVAYIDEENSIHTIGKRISKLMKDGLFCEEDKTCFRYYLQPNIKLNHGSDGLKSILDDLKEFSPDVIFIDAFTRVFEGDENSSEQTKGVFEGVKLLRRLLDKPDLAIVFAHHTRKDATKSGYSIRGSSDIMAQPEATFILEKHENKDNELLFIEYKSRNEKIAPILIELVDSDDKTGLKLEFKEAPTNEEKQEKKETEGMKENCDRVFKYLDSHNNRISSEESKLICTSQRYGNLAISYLLNRGDIRICPKKEGRKIIYERNEFKPIIAYEENLND